MTVAICVDSNSQLPRSLRRRFDIEVVYEQAGEAKLQQLVLVRNSVGNVVTEAFDVAIIDVEDSSDEPTVVEWAPATVWPERPIDREERIVLDVPGAGEAVLPRPQHPICAPTATCPWLWWHWQG